MRTVTGGEAAVLTSAAFAVFWRVQVADGDNTLKDLTALGSPTLNYVRGLEIDANIDQPVAQATVWLRRDQFPAASVLSLSPLREDSVLNRKADLSYAPLLDPGRKLRIEVAQIAYGTSPVAGDWKRLFDGFVDVVEWSEDPIRIVARDEGSILVDRFAPVPRTLDFTSSPKAIETVIDDDILDAEFGVGVVPLYTPTSPGFNLKTFRYDREPIMDALQRLVQVAIGWDIRFWWHEASTAFRLTLKNPDRAKTTPDATLGAGMYVGARALALDRNLVRNRIEVVFGPSNNRQTGTADDVTSQNRFGYRVLHIEEASDSPISTLTEANNMAAAILSDLAFPKADLEVEMLMYWPVELFDLVRFSNNAVHFNTNQDLGVVGVRHVAHMESEGSVSNRTFLQVRGKPAGAYRSWYFPSFRNPVPSRPAPTASISRVLPIYRTYETLKLDGAIGAGDVGPRQYRYRISSQNLGNGVGEFSNWSSAALPTNITVTRKPFNTVSVGLEVRQGDLQSRLAHYTVGAYMDDSQEPRENTPRRGDGGIGLPARFIFAQPTFNRGGTTPLLDVDLERVTDDLRAADGVKRIESRFGAKTKAAIGAGQAAQGIGHEDDSRRAIGGQPVPGQHYVSSPYYDATGATPLIDPSTKRIQADMDGPTGIGMDVVESGGNKADGALESTTALKSTTGIKEGTAVSAIYRHREEITVNGADADGDVAVTFGLAYQNAPLVIFRGGQYVSFSNTLGTSALQRLRIQALNVTTSGFTSRAQIAVLGTLTAQTDDFASGNILDAQGETAEVNLDPAGAVNDTYNVQYRVTVNVDNAGNPGLHTATLVLAIDTNDGGGWVERATYNYSASAPLGDSNSLSWNSESKQIVVSGLGTNDDIRIRAKSFSVSNGGTGSFDARGADAGGSNPDTRNGVTYSTTGGDTVESAIPGSSDSVVWVAQEVA